MIAVERDVSTEDRKSHTFGGGATSRPQVHNRNVTHVFRFSNIAFYSLLREARISGNSVYQVFRRRAYQLQTLIDPVFQVSGDELTRVLEIGVCGAVMAELEHLVKDLDVPRECLGELIACAVLPDVVTA